MSAAADPEAGPHLPPILPADFDGRMRRCRAFLVAQGAVVVGRRTAVRDQSLCAQRCLEREYVGVAVSGQVGWTDLGDIEDDGKGAGLKTNIAAFREVTHARCVDYRRNPQRRGVLSQLGARSGNPERRVVEEGY